MFTTKCYHVFQKYCQFWAGGGGGVFFKLSCKVLLFFENQDGELVMLFCSLCTNNHRTRVNGEPIHKYKLPINDKGSQQEYKQVLKTESINWKTGYVVNIGAQRYVTI